MSVEDNSIEEEERIEDLECYRLDYEEPTTIQEEPRAAGGEILQAGDHVYMWCTLYQHHGIVVETTPTTTSLPSSSYLLIAEFTNVALLGADNLLLSASTASGAVSTNGVTGGFRFVRETNPSQWHKVKYQANPVECMTWRPGTCSAACPSNAETILKRVLFLKECRHLIPDYHILASNCETVAVWCVTGQWETLQGNGVMLWSKMGAVASMGLISAGVGAAAGGLAVWHNWRISNKWQETAELLNKEFEWYATGKSPKLIFKPT